MKKISKVLALIALCAFVVLPVVGCGINMGGGYNNDPYNGNGAQMRAMLKDSSVNMEGVAAIGISKVAKSSVSGVAFNAPEAGAETKQVAVKRMADENVENEEDSADNKLVVMKDDGEIEEVVFEKEGEEIKQEKIGYIYKTFVGKEFTYICYSSYPMSDYSYNDPDYMRRDYRCEWNMQSFVIHNETGKVFALADLSDSPDGFSIDIFDGGVRVRDYRGGWNNGKTYKISFENDALKAEDIMPNKNIEVYSIRQDKFGTLFVEINADIDGSDSTSCVYYSQSEYDNRLVLGSDGRMYNVVRDRNDHNKRIVKVYNENRECVAIEQGLNVSLADYYWSWEKLIIKDGYLFEINGSNINVSVMEGETTSVFGQFQYHAGYDYGYGVVDTQLRYLYNTIIEGALNNVPAYVMGGEVFVVKAKTSGSGRELYHVSLDGFVALAKQDKVFVMTDQDWEPGQTAFNASITYEKVEGIASVSRVTENGPSLTVTYESLFATTNYLVTMDSEGLIQVETTGGSSYSGSILVLQPLN